MCSRTLGYHIARMRRMATQPVGRTAGSAYADPSSTFNQPLATTLAVASFEDARDSADKVLLI